MCKKYSVLTPFEFGSEQNKIAIEWDLQEKKQWWNCLLYYLLSLLNCKGLHNHHMSVIWVQGWGYSANVLCTLIFANFQNHASHFMCHHELWPTSVSHPFSSLNSSLGLTEGKYYQKITVPVFRLVLKNFALPGCFLYIIFFSYLFSLLPSGWFVVAVCGCFSVRELVK